MTARRGVLRALLLPATLVALLTGTLTGCSGDDDSPSAQATPTSSPTSAPPSPTPTRAAIAPRPQPRSCYHLDFTEALAPTSDASPVPCRRPHTSLTYAVGTLDTVVDGHLLAVDSRRVQEQVARICPARLRGFLGASPESLRLSMLRAVWFTPSVEQSDAGADWYRCDVIAVATDERLAPLTGPLAGVLSTSTGRDRYGMCGTAAPDARDFTRVVCSGPHTWRAIRTVALPGRRYPGEAAAREAGQQTCEDAARAVAPDALSFEWGYEWPTKEQWGTGQTYGLCWAPD